MFSKSFCLTICQFFYDVFPCQTFFYHQNHCMIQEIRDLIFDFFRIRILCCDHNFRCFFSNFFRILSIPYQTDNSCKTPPLDSLYGLRSCHIPIQRSEADSSHHSQFLQAAGRSRSDYRYGMLLRSDLLLQAMYPDHSQPSGILHTGNDRSSPLYPEFLPASAKIRHLSCLDRLIERFLIHICQHQNLLCLIMLDDDRDQALIICLKL